MMGKRLVYLDTCAIIALVEGKGDVRAKLAEKLRNASLAVSDLGWLECAVGPQRTNNSVLLARYRAFFALPEVVRFGLDRGVFEHAAELRARHGWKTPDALHVAAAISARCDAFLTFDQRLVAVGPRIQFVVMA